MNCSKPLLTRKRIALLLIEAVILAVLFAIYIYRNSDTHIVSSPISEWSSEYTTYDNGWTLIEGSLPVEEYQTEPAILVSGHCRGINKGSYEVSVDYSCSTAQSLTISTMGQEETIKLPDPADMILDPTKQNIKMHFYAKDNIEDFEIRITYNGIGDITVNDVTVSSSAYFNGMACLWALLLFVIIDLIILFSSYEPKDVSDGVVSGEKNTTLDLLRVVAAVMVLSVHIGNSVGINMGVGKWGVQLFFVLSGYLAFVSLDRDPDPVKYYKKRALRILPTYWFCLVLIYIEALISGIFIDRLPLSDLFSGLCGPRFLRYVFMFHYFTPTEDWFKWNNYNVLWTMSAFLLFYLLAPWLYRLLKNFGLGFLILCIMLFTRKSLIQWLNSLFSGYPEEAHIDWLCEDYPVSVLYCFLIGCVLFLAIKERKETLYLVIAALAIVFTSFNWYTIELLFLLLVGFAVTGRKLTENEKLTKIISWLAGGSFTLYLMHPLILKIEDRIWPLTGWDNTWLRSIIEYLICIFISYAFHYLAIARIEKAIRKRV